MEAQLEQQIHIDPGLVEKYIAQMALHGAHGEGGVWRTVYSPEWVAATDLYARWCEEAGLAVRKDAVGNIWGRLEGREGGKSIVSGSHIDTQRPGGRYDGTLGALAGLIALKALREQFGPPRRTLEAVALCEEEHSRFPTTNFWGSRAIIGAIEPGVAENMRGYADETMAEAMLAVGLDPADIPSARRDDIDAFIELHIEQGPILEHADLPVAVVDAITGMRHWHVTLRGEQNHAGAFPMDLRHDPMAGFAEIAMGVIGNAERMGRPAVTTIGHVTAHPGNAPVIPGEVSFTIDARHPDPDQRQQLYRQHEDLMREVADRRGLDVCWSYLVDHAPCLSDPALVSTLVQAAGECGIRHMVMPSGASHDSQQMSKVARVAMIFVRSEGGRSHTPEEFSALEDIVEGIRLLAAGLYKLAY